MKKIMFFGAIAVVCGLLALIVYNYKTKTSLKYQHEDAPQVQENVQDEVSKKIIDEAKKEVEEGALRKVDDKILQIADDEYSLGQKDAPVVVVEYASLSCPHCAAFYREAFYKMKDEYIDSGKVRFVYRDFPLNQPALAAAMTAFCRAQDEPGDKADTYNKFIKALFKTQDSWAFDQKYIDKIEAIAMLDGMSQKRFRDCIEDKKLQEKILERRMDAAKSLQIHSTPTFFINGEVVEGFVDYRSIKKVIDKNLQK